MAALATGSQSEATLSKLYGGSAEEGVSELSVAVPVYEAIGKVGRLVVSGPCRLVSNEYSTPSPEPHPPSWAHIASCFMLQVITISGRTIRKEAQADPEIAEHAISCIDKLLSICPEQDIKNAQELRKMRPKAV